MWPNPQFPAHLVTFTEEICNEKLHFLCTVYLKLILHRYFSRNFPRFWVIAYNVFEFQDCLLHKCRKTTTWTTFAELLLLWNRSRYLLLTNKTNESFTPYSELPKPKALLRKVTQHGEDRSSHPKVCYKNVVIKDFAKFTGRQLCRSLIFNKVIGKGPVS